MDGGALNGPGGPAEPRSLPAIAGGIGVGALVDGLMSRRDSRISGVQVSWKF
jgi:hypothetical protein